MKILFICILGLSLKTYAEQKITKEEILPPESSLSDYSVKRWGAVGDGVSDDYPSIKKAIMEQAPYGKVILYFPPGKYKISQSIKINGALNNTYHDFKFLIEGAGKTETEVFVSDKDLDTFFLDGGTGDKKVRGILTNMALGPERQTEDKGWSVNAVDLTGSVVQNIATEGPKCSIRSLNGGSSYGGISPGKSQGGLNRPVCLQFK